jgi:hypothetical protein
MPPGFLAKWEKKLKIEGKAIPQWVIYGQKERSC